MKKNSLIYTVFFTFLTAFFFVFFLSLANEATKDLVQLNQKASVQRAILTALGVDFKEPGKAYSERFTRIPNPGDTMTTRIDGESVQIHYFSGSGLWGTVTGIIALDEKANRIVGLDIISHNETPGLGGRIDETWFKEQFRGEKIPSEGIIVRKGRGRADTDSENGFIDGITGASQTSRSMQTIVNAAVSAVKGDIR